MSMIKIKIICIFINLKKGNFNKPSDWFKKYILWNYTTQRSHILLLDNSFDVLVVL